jgi:tRNA pseudouridine55 synthase
MKEGIILVNKPNGLTSHDVVARIRRKFGIKKVGHAGTLDPLATGVLVILVGKSTKLSDRFMGLDKAYRSTMLLGTKTNSADTEGAILQEKPFQHISREQVENVFKEFTGEIKQLPPMFSAIKFKGKKLYELARKGVTVEREARDVNIGLLKVIRFELPYVEFYMECSKGTYVRQLADDVGDKLGCGACITQIERTKVGSFHIDQSVNIEDVNESHLRPWIN